MTEFLKDSLHTISQWMLVPTIVILLLLILLSAAAAGGIIVEAVTERSAVKANVPSLILSMHGKSSAQIREMIENAKIFKRHREALYTILDNGDKPEEILVAAARRLISDEENVLERKSQRTEIASKIAPMFGLMGTLIPLGPGLMALGQGDTQTLSQSLLIAFDTTVAGLLAAAVCFVISKLRRRWYDDYMVSLETMMDAVLEEISAENVCRDRLSSGEAGAETEHYTDACGADCIEDADEKDGGLK